MAQSYVSPIHPQTYPQQHNYVDCGLFSVKAIIESYYPKYCHHAKHYARSWLHKFVGFSSQKSLVSILRKCNIDAHSGFCSQRTQQGEIRFLKNLLHEGPVILTIAHAYSKQSQFSILRSLLYQHYISVWGYNDEYQQFYCYDSHTNLAIPNLPVGNIAIHYDDLVSYWQLCGLGLYGKRYIAITGLL